MKLKLTPNGIDLLMRCLEGGPTINFSKISLGNGENAGEETDSMSNPLISIEISSLERNGEFVELIAEFNNANIENKFRATELGVFAIDPNDSTGEGNLLFAYGYTPPEDATVIPAYTDRTFETIEKVSVYVGSAENVSAVISESLQTVTKKEYQEHLEATNPHKVTANDVGLGKVENKAINDQTPSFDVSEENQEIKSGENISTLFGKIAKAIKSFFEHLDDKSNPHQLNAESINAAKKEHTHNTNDINSGILPTARGGTGYSKLEDMVKNNNQLFRRFSTGTYTGNGEKSRIINVSGNYIETIQKPVFIIVLNTKHGMGSPQKGVYGGGCGRVYHAFTPSTPEGYNLSFTNQYTSISIVQQGFEVYENETLDIHTNKQGEIYNFIAFM